MPAPETPAAPHVSTTHAARGRHGPVGAALAARFRLDLRSLAAFRIAIGGVVAADALLRCRDFSLMFTPEGMFPHAALRAFQPTWAAWSLAFVVDAAWWDAALLGLQGLTGILLAVGFTTRPMTVVAWAAVVSVVRRTAPATNAGDLWLAALLFWGMFLPLGDRWSLDALRGRCRSWTDGPADHGHVSQGHVSLRSVAFILQVLVVYLTAGLAKCNATWLSGTAVQTALSVHDHGTALGAWFAGLPWLPQVAGSMIILLELGGPLLFLMTPDPRVRSLVVASFVLFHTSVALLMSVGLFAPIGIAAWLALVPGAAWEAAMRINSADRHGGTMDSIVSRRDDGDMRLAIGTWLRLAGEVVCGACLLLAASDAAIRLTTPRSQLPTTLQLLLDTTCLRQSWEMFGTVPDQEQWAYACALLADGSQVDLLRDGQPLERERPSGGFTSLPHHRWHKLFWELPKPPLRVFSPSVARAIAEQWNRSQPPSRRARRVEICFARLSGTAGTRDEQRGVLHELVLATWPARDPRGGGSLDRWLEEHGEPEPAGDGESLPLE